MRSGTSRLPVLLSLLVASSLLVLAWPRLSASLRYLPVDTALARYWQGDEITSEQLRGLSDRAAEALALHEHYRYRDGLSILLYLSASSDNLNPADQRELLKQSTEAAIKSVTDAPMQPMTWLRIAAARTSLQRPSSEIAPALRMSMYTGRVEPSLLLLRLELAYRHMPYPDGEEAALLRDQTALAWKLQPQPFLNRIRSGAIEYTRVAQLLASSHGAILAEMERMLGQTAR